MTTRITRIKKNSETIRRRKFSGIGLYRRRSVGMKKYLKTQIRGRRSPQLSIEAAPVSSWICTSTSWTNMKTVDMPTSEFCSDESVSSTIFEDFGNDQFIRECLLLYNEWIWEMEQCDSDVETTYSDEEEDSSATVYSLCNSSCTECELAELFEWMGQWRSDEILQESMILFIEWTTVNAEEEIVVEEETKSLMGTPPSKRSDCTSYLTLSTISSSRNLDDRRIHSFLLSEDDETNEDFDEDSSSCGVVSSSSSGQFTACNGGDSSVDSSSDSISGNHVIVPSDWIDSIRDSLPTTHAFNSDVSSSSSGSFTDSSISDSECEKEDKIDSILRTAPTTRITANPNGVFDEESSSSSSTSDYESETEPVVLKKITTVSSSTQTSAATQTSTVRALAECDDLLEKLMEIKKKLKAMM